MLAYGDSGHIVPDIRATLTQAADTAIHRFRNCRGVPDPPAVRHGDFLVTTLRMCVDRMNNLPASSYVAIATAAHIQRVCLELTGLTTYLTVVLPRLHSNDDFSERVLDVVGAFLRHPDDIHTFWRVGLPFWTVQPLREDLAVWQVVDCQRFQSSAREFGRVANKTGNWLKVMVMKVSELIAASHLSPMTMPPDAEPPAKRPRIDHGETRTIARHAGRSFEHKTKSPEPTRPDGGDRSLNEGAATPTEKKEKGKHPPQPPRTFVPSAFYDIPSIWKEALQKHQLPPTTAPTYFYPPPFLLDAIYPGREVPPGCLRPNDVRRDPKSERYLHNLVRIRGFCRARLFSPPLSQGTFNLTQWRMALWGDYEQKEYHAKDSRGKRRLGWRNEFAEVLSLAFGLVVYREDLVVRLGDFDVDATAIKKEPRIRAHLLWEAHEINFRTELLALDALIMQTSKWTEYQKWDREALVSGVWGPPSSALTALPPEDPSQSRFLWITPPEPGWEECKASLRNFSRVLNAWPGCPTEVAAGWKGDLSTPEAFREVQQAAVDYYVSMFVIKYNRLPIVPIRFPKTTNDA